MIVELVSCRDQALATSTPHRQFFFESQHLRSSYSFVSSESSECQWVPLIKCPVMSILDVSPLQLALGYLSDVAAAVVKYRRSHVDGTADRNRRKEPLFPSPVINSCEDANNVSQDRSNSAPTASSVASGQLQQKKSLAATLIENAKKDTIALVPSDIARLAQRFFPLFNFSLFPHKPPPAAMANRVLFTDAEDGLLALGLQEYNNDWGAIQKRFLPCKSQHQIFVRQKNRSSSKAPDNPVKEVRRMKTSPLTIEEIECIREGLRMFKNDWTSVWRFVVPHRDPSLLQRQWRVASGVQKSYNKSEAAKEKRRSYEAKRRKLRASMPNSRVVHEQEADNNTSEDVENDDDSYVNEAFLEDTDRSTNMTACQLPLSRNAGKSMIMQSGTSLDEECGATGGYIEPQKGSGTNLDVITSYIPFISSSDGPSSVRTPCTTAPKASCASLDQLQASRLCKEKGSRVVKLAPDLPPVNLPPSVRVISQVAFHQNATHLNGTSDSAAKDVYPVPPLTFTESAYRQLNLFPDHSTSSRLQQNGVSNDNNTEDGAEQDFQMHPLLFQYPRDVLSSCSHPVQNLINHSRKYDLYPFEKVQVERSNNQTTGSTENGITVNANTIDFHPLLQRTEIEMHDEVPEDDYHHSVNQSECNMRGAQVDDQSTAGQASTSPCERENDIDLNINLCSPSEFKNANDFKGNFSESNVQDEGSRKNKASVSELEFVNACSHHCIQEPNEESMQGIVMEQEELSDSEDSQHVEFECEEMDDSEEEQDQGVETSLVQNKGTSTSVVCGEFLGSTDQSQIQQGLVKVGKQDASSMQKLQGSSRSVRAKLKSETTKRTGSRANQRLSTSRTGETSRTKTRNSKMKKGQSSAARKSSDSKRTRKTPAPC
uniref:Myb-like domain-containing protein n=1 Tax=Arundo donax TaxID=35708 RepID=A0A0A9D3M1_ARUDO